MIATAIILAVIAIPLTIIQVQKQQQLKQRAAGEPTVSLQFSPLTENKMIEVAFNIELRLINTNGKDISGFSGIISYNTNRNNVLELVRFSPSSEFETIINDKDLAPGALVLTVVNPEKRAINNTDILLGILTFKGKNVGTSEVTISLPKVTASGFENSLAVDTSSIGKYTISSSSKDISAALPTSTPTPIPARIPSSQTCFDSCMSRMGTTDQSCTKECRLATLSPTPTPLPPYDTQLITCYNKSGCYDEGFRTKKCRPDNTANPYCNTTEDCLHIFCDNVIPTSTPIPTPTPVVAIATTPAPATPTPIPTPSFCNALTPPSQAPPGCSWTSSILSPAPANCASQGGTACRPSDGSNELSCMHFTLSCPQAPQTPSPATGNTVLAISLNLEGISIEKTPQGVAKGNPNPKKKTRSTTIELLNANNQIVSTRTIDLAYDSASGLFKGTANLGNSFASGNYLIKIRTERYLKRLFPGILNIIAGQAFTVPTLTLLAGDVNGDNELNMLDYNIFVSCFGAKATKASCTDKVSADVNDDEVIDGVDYNLFAQSLAKRRGD